MRTCPIFFSFDNNYVTPAAVAFWSLLDRSREDVYWEMWVLHHDISQENQELLAGIVRRSGKGHLGFVDTGDFLLEEWSRGSWEGHQSRSQFTSDTVVRCFGARFFPQYDKIVYSDVDVVFQDDISELLDVDVSSVYLAGVKNAFMKFDKNELSHLSESNYQLLKDSYLAGGIWVLNLKKMRDENLESRMIEIIKDDSVVKRWNDQDVINIACEGKVAFLPLNYIGYPYLRERLERPGFTSHFSRAELYDSILHPKIIHYAAEKPWDKDVNYGELWWTIYSFLGLKWERCNRRKSADSNAKICRLRKVRFRLSLLAFVLSALCLCLAWKMFTD